MATPDAPVDLLATADALSRLIAANAETLPAGALVTLHNAYNVLRDLAPAARSTD